MSLIFLHFYFLFLCNYYIHTSHIYSSITSHCPWCWASHVLLIRQVTAVDCHLGVNQLVYGPSALTHVFADKTATIRDSTFVGASPRHTCIYQDSISPFKTLYNTVFWDGGVQHGSNTALVFASFTSSVNSELYLLMFELDSYFNNGAKHVPMYSANK